MKEFIKNLKFAWKYAIEQKYNIIKYIIATIIAIIISIVIPILSARLIINLTDSNFYQLIFLALVCFGVENIRNITWYLIRYYSKVVYRETFIKLETDLGKEILKIENKSLDNHSSGVFIKRLTNDTSRISDIFGVLNSNIGSIVTNLGMLGAIFIINPLIFICLIMMLLVIYLVEHKRVDVYNKKDKIFRKKEENVSGFVGEVVRGARDIKMLNAEDSFIKKLHEKIVDLNSSRYDMMDIDSKYTLLSSFTRDLTDLLMIFLLAIMLVTKNMNAATALIVYNFSRQTSWVIDDVGLLLERIKDFNLSVSRIFAIINSDEFKKEKFGSIHLDEVKGNFEFKDVVFSYDKNKVLDKVSFKIKALETVAFVGKTGVGKTTIFNLLCKMYDIDSGVITIDDIDIKKLDKDTIRGSITIISQNPYIFNLSIKDNLKLVKQDLTDEEMKEACKLACLDDFIKSLPFKYDTIVGEGGVNLSGGEKQRLAIARALIQKTEIILFDEATSALDNVTQEKISQAINNMKKDYTILIIAHRLSTIKNADRIIFLEDGKIIAEGSHHELLKKCPSYKKLYEVELVKK